MIKTITNHMSSILDLSAIKDVAGNPVTLRPAGSPGDKRDLPQSSWQHDAVQRVLEMKWASLDTPGVMPDPEPAQPPPETVVTPPAPEVVTPPAPESIVPPAPETMTASETPASSEAPAEPASVPVEPPTTAPPSDDRSRRSRNR